MSGVTTLRFRVPASRVVRVLAMRHGLWWGLAAALCLAVCVILALTLDPRFWIAALMVVCMLVPLGCALLFFWYAMGEVTALNVIDHVISLDEEGMTVTVYPQRPRTPRTDELSPERIRMLRDGGDEESSSLPEERVMRYEADELEGIAFGVNELLVPVRRRSGVRGVFLVPVEAFGEGKELMERFIGMLTRRAETAR